MHRAADALLSLLPGSERAFFNRTCSAMQGVADPRMAGGSDVPPTGTQTPPTTILGSQKHGRSHPQLQMLRIFSVPEGTRLGCTAAIPVTFTGIRGN